MNDEFARIWQQFVRDPEGEKREPCAVAIEFQRKMEAIIFAHLAQGHTRQQIAQGKFMLQEQYHAWRRSIPLQHVRSAIGKHRCVLDVYEDCYDRLHLLELRLRPAINAILDYDELTKPAPIVQVSPPPSPALTYTGLYMGDEEDE